MAINFCDSHVGSFNAQHNNNNNNIEKYEEKKNGRRVPLLVSFWLTQSLVVSSSLSTLMSLVFGLSFCLSTDWNNNCARGAKKTPCDRRLIVFGKATDYELIIIDGASQGCPLH